MNVSTKKYITYVDVRKADNKAKMYCTFNGPKSKQCRKYTIVADELYLEFLKQFIIKDDDDTSE